MHKKEGFIGFYRGLQTDMIRVLPMTGITFLAYETMNNYFGSFEWTYFTINNNLDAAEWKISSSRGF